MDDNVTYLGNIYIYIYIYGIYKEYIRNIHCHKYLWYKIIRNTDPMGRPPKAAAPLGRRRRRRLCVCDYFIFYIIDIYGYISYTFLIYSIYAYMFPRYVPCIFPCVFLNLWSQERVRRWRKSDLWSQEEVRTWRKSEFWSNLARFGSRNGILTKWHNDSASFLLEKLKNQVILTKNPNIWPKIPKIPEKSPKIPKIPRNS